MHQSDLHFVKSHQFSRTDGRQKARKETANERQPFKTVNRGPIDRCESHSLPTAHFYLVNILRLETFENDIERNIWNHLQDKSGQNVYVISHTRA